MAGAGDPKNHCKLDICYKARFEGFSHLDRELKNKDCKVLWGLLGSLYCLETAISRSTFMTSSLMLFSALSFLKHSSHLIMKQLSKAAVIKLAARAAKKWCT